MNVPGHTTTSRAALEPADYARAEELWPDELLCRVANALVIPTWLEGEDRFWFKLEHLNAIAADPDADGRTSPRFTKTHEYVIVDAATGERSPAFDHRLLAAALSADPAELPVESFVYDGDAVAVTLTDGVPASAFNGDGDPLVADPAMRARLRIEPDGTVAPAATGDPNAFRGPDGLEAFVRDHNLWLRERDGLERQLTNGGEAFYGWAGLPDGDYGNFRIPRDRHGTPPTTVGCFFSPDGRQLLACRVDERDVTAYPYLETVPPDGDPIPRVHHVRRRSTGDQHASRWEWYLIDLEGGAQTAVSGVPEGFEIQPWHVWWTEHGTLLGLAGTQAQDAAALIEIDRADARARVVYSERDHMFRSNNVWFHDDNVGYLAARAEFVWFSFMSGWPQLWAIDVGSGGIRQLTDGNWVVSDLLRINDEHLFFTACGIRPGENPYHRSLYRIDLDGTGPNAGLTCLTPEPSDHALPPIPQATTPREWGAQPYELRSCISPSGRYFVDNISRLDLPTVTLLRDADGKTTTELAKAEIGGLDAIGWNPPESFRVKASDGETDIWGVLVKPRNFDASCRWPVHERIYGGHQVLAQPRSFLEGINGSFMFALHAFAELGFVIVLMDGPGTPLRSRHFRDMTWAKPDRFGLSEHRAVIQRLAATRPWMDISHMGVSGHSSGGYTALMCLLLEPDFYKVAFASSPAAPPRSGSAMINEAHLGLPDYGDGRSLSRYPGEHAYNHDVYDPATYVDRLSGRLALVYGDIDEEVEAPTVMQFVHALIAAGMDYDLIAMPGRDHFYTTEPYFQKRLWDYFIENCQDRMPLRHHRLTVQPGQCLSET
jgi:dipeptidyl-peptidase-4